MPTLSEISRETKQEKV